MTALAAQGVDVAPRRRRRLSVDPLLALTGLAIGLVVLIAILAPVLTPYSPDQVDILSASQGPSAAHWLGTDSLGRDVLTRLAYGARLSLLGPALVTVLATAAGSGIALFGAWRGGWFDRATVRVLDVAFAFPALVFGVLAVAVLGTGLIAPVIALSIAYTPYIARVVRSVATRERHLAYVEACQLLGYSPWRTVGHMTRNIRTFIVAQGI